MSSEPKLLLFDTATARATVCLARGSEVLAHAAREVTTHSEGLFALIDEVLRDAGLGVGDLDALICGRGPGSFTGLRIGMATAKGLCMAARLPLYCVSTLVAPAEAAATLRGRERCVLSVLDARRGEVFAALARDGRLNGEELVCRAEQLAERLGDLPGEAVVLAGDGALHYAELLSVAFPGSELAPPSCHQLDARHLLPAGLRALAEDAAADLASVTPVYLRAPDIRQPKPKVAVEPESEPSEAELAELIERLRQTGLRLDRAGRWWHEGEVVRHARLAAALHRWLDRLPDGRYVLRLDAERYAYVEVEDAPYVVRTIEREGPAEAQQLFVLLSDGTREELAYETLRVGRSEALYCEVKGRFPARLSRQAQHLLGELIVEVEGGFELAAAGRRYAIAGD